MPAQAQDATWLFLTSTAVYATSTNWTPATVPTGTAFFGAPALRTWVSRDKRSLADGRSMQAHQLTLLSLVLARSRSTAPAS
jgi:hypothetical protein